MNQETVSRLSNLVRPGLSKYLVGLQDSDGSYRPLGLERWTPTQDGSIAKARRDYDDGLVDLVQQRLGEGEYALFAIPLKKKAERWSTFRR